VTGNSSACPTRLRNWPQAASIVEPLRLRTFTLTPYCATPRVNAANAAEFVSAVAYTELFDRMGLYFAPEYDIASNQFLSTEYGVRLKSPCDCWAMDVGVTDSYNPNETQIQVQITLGGLGSVGQRPFGRNPFQRAGLVGSPTGVLPTY